MTFSEWECLPEMESWLGKHQDYLEYTQPTHTWKTDKNDFEPLIRPESGTAMTVHSQSPPRSSVILWRRSQLQHFSLDKRVRLVEVILHFLCISVGYWEIGILLGNRSSAPELCLIDLYEMSLRISMLETDALSYLLCGIEWELLDMGVKGKFCIVSHAVRNYEKWCLSAVYIHPPSMMLRAGNRSSTLGSEPSSATPRVSKLLIKSRALSLSARICKVTITLFTFIEHLLCAMQQKAVYFGVKSMNSGVIISGSMIHHLLVMWP